MFQEFKMFFLELFKDKKNKKNILNFVIMFLITVPYLFTFLFLDEADNYLGGLEIAKGAVAYRDFFSQHTPLMYYISGFFAFLGVKSIIGFRICFYLLMTLVIFFIHLRNKKYIGKSTILFGFLFFIDLSLTPCGINILSEHIQSLSILVLFLEFYRYTYEKIINFKTAIIIALSSLFSVGTAFVSIYAVSFVFLGFVIFEIIEIIENKKYDFKKVLKNYFILIGVSLVVYIIFFGYFAINGALGKFYYQSYVFNKEVYSKYLGGFGSDPIKAAIDCINGYISYLRNSVLYFNVNNYLPARTLLLSFTNLVFIIYLFRKKCYLGFTVLGVIIFTGMRGFWGFHSIAYYAISWLAIAILIKHFFSEKKQIIVLLLVLGIIFPPYCETYKPLVREIKREIKKSKTINSTDEYTSYINYINKYTKKGDYIYNCTIAPELYFRNKNNCRPACKALVGLVPWFTDIFMRDFLDDIENKKPNLIFFQPEADVWGYKYSDFCAPIQKLLNEKYVQLINTIDSNFSRGGNYSAVWIRKDLLDIYGLKIMKINPIYKSYKEPITPLSGLLNNVVFSQVFIAKTSKIKAIDIQVGTYQRINETTLFVSIFDNLANKKIFERKLDASKFEDNAITTIFLEDIPTTIGKEYRIDFYSQNKEGSCITLYRTESLQKDFNGYSIINGIKQEYNLYITIYDDNYLENKE